MSGDPFATRFHAAADARSPFCVGVDPSPSVLIHAGLPDDVGGVRVLCEALIGAAGGLASAVKMQLAFFERFGAEGIRELERASALAHEHGLLVILDGKRGDVGTTIEGYADAFFGPKSSFQADAVTVNAYMGFDALLPLFDRAANFGAAAFVVVLSSNPEGVSIQSAVLPDRGITVADHLAEMIAGYNERADAEIVGAVIGATVGTRATSVLSSLSSRALILAPGIGAQGASFEDASTMFEGHVRRVLPTVSRGVLSQGASHNALRAAVADGSRYARVFRANGRIDP